MENILLSHSFIQFILLHAMLLSLWLTIHNQLVELEQLANYLCIYWCVIRHQNMETGCFKNMGKRVVCNNDSYFKGFQNESLCVNPHNMFSNPIIRITCSCVSHSHLLSQSLRIDLHSHPAKPKLFSPLVQLKTIHTNDQSSTFLRASPSFCSSSAMVRIIQYKNWKFCHNLRPFTPRTVTIKITTTLSISA